LEARGQRSKTSTNKVSAMPQKWLPGAFLEFSRSAVEVSAFRSWRCLHAALVRLITENIPTVEAVWWPVASGPRPPPTRSLLYHTGWLRGSCFEPSRSVMVVSAFRSWTYLHAALVRLITEHIPTVEPVWRPVAAGPRPPPKRCLLFHRGGCVDPAWSPVDQ